MDLNVRRKRRRDQRRVVKLAACRGRRPFAGECSTLQACRSIGYGLLLRSWHVEAMSKTEEAMSKNGGNNNKKKPSKPPMENKGPKKK